jgi:hypothetical protein
MTKPFESIRQLFGRVLGNNPAGQDTPEYSTLGIGSPDAQRSTNGNGHSNSFAVENSEPDIETQTADTQRLPQVAPEFLGSRNGASRSRVEHDESADEFGDALLDLGDTHGAKAFVGDDPFLDVLDEAAPHDEVFVKAVAEPTALADDGRESVWQSGTGVSPVIDAQDARATETVVEVAQPEKEAEESAPASSASPANLSDLSPEAIDAIAQRVVAQLSDKVVREIAWEVVPELSELLIKQRLDEK